MHLSIIVIFQFSATRSRNCEEPASASLGDVGVPVYLPAAAVRCRDILPDDRGNEVQDNTEHDFTATRVERAVTVTLLRHAQTCTINTKNRANANLSLVGGHRFIWQITLRQYCTLLTGVPLFDAFVQGYAVIYINSSM